MNSIAKKLRTFLDEKPDCDCSQLIREAANALICCSNSLDVYRYKITKLEGENSVLRHKLSATLEPAGSKVEPAGSTYKKTIERIEKECVEQMRIVQRCYDEFIHESKKLNSLIEGVKK